VEACLSTSASEATILKLSFSFATVFPSRMALTVAVYLPADRPLMDTLADVLSVVAL
jgi:hypothetical protein